MKQDQGNIGQLDMNFQPGAKEMAAPKPERAGRGKAVFWALVALLLVGAIVWWIQQPEASRKEMRADAAEKINGLLAETPLAGIGHALLDTPPPSPATVLRPPTDPGTLAGPVVSGSIGAGLDLNAPASSAATPAADGTEQVASPEAQPVQEDKEVSPFYLQALAEWLAERYHPATGRLGVTAQTLNHYGGATLASRARGGRPGLLRYAFQPSMLEGLYKLYIDRFMGDLNEAAQKRGFTSDQNRQFHMALAGKTTLWAAGLEGILNLPNLKGSLDSLDNLAQKAVDANIQLTTAVFELDDLREAKASKQQLETAQLRVDGLAARYRRANEEHAAAQRNLVAQIRQKSGQSLDAETLLFMAAWAERRISQDSHGEAALRNCVSLLRDLGRRCASFGSKV